MHNWQDWRKKQRIELIEKRKAIAQETHRQWSLAITTALETNFSILQNMKIGLYWPFRSEYDPQPIALYFSKLGATLALPEVINKYEPLCFREWWPDAPMKNGAYGIPIPDDTPIITIDAAIVPMVGFDQKGYRLGYGSGYFDRTLATYQQQPLTIGIAFEIQRLDSVHPQPHDIAMHYVVTEAGVFSNGNNEFETLAHKK
ncbi:MAG: 5-formyltetrahydrofolate cyclo-ligase [Betaproteobacteria bacterium]|nr:5-formyltetrahydrofolate cyclo-ligase [Betaproteobacteria bacterium]